MAEAVAAVADAVIAVCATVVIMTTLFTVIIPSAPYFAAGLVWSGITRMLVNIDVFFALGGGLFASMMVYPAAAYALDTQSGSGLQKAMKAMHLMQYNAALGGAGLVGGLVHLATGNMALGMVGLMGGAFLGYKFGWNMLTNFYLSLGILGKYACVKGQEGSHNACIPMCTPASAAEKKAWDAQYASVCNDPKNEEWCKQKKSYDLDCPWLGKASNPGPLIWRSENPPASDGFGPTLPFEPYCQKFNVDGSYWYSQEFSDKYPGWGSPDVVSGGNPLPAEPFVNWNPNGNFWQCNFWAGWLKSDGLNYDWYPYFNPGAAVPANLAPAPPKSKAASK